MANFVDKFITFIMVLTNIVIYLLEDIYKFFLPHKCCQKNVLGKTVLVTGAGSGIGKLMAKRFSQLGCKLVLWDIDTDAIESVAKDLSSTVSCQAYTVDLSNKEDIYKAAALVKLASGHIDILVNNAGIVTGKSFLECRDDQVEKTMDVNVCAHFWTLKAFLPSMMERDSGHIVTIASVMGLFGYTGMADYSASKFAAVGFHESIQQELATMGKTRINTTLVCPYLITTGMFEGVTLKYTKLFPSLTPEYAADRIIDAVLCNQTFVVMPRIFYVINFMKSILPYRVTGILCEISGLNHFMDTFAGRGGRAMKQD